MSERIGVFMELSENKKRLVWMSEGFVVRVMFDPRCIVGSFLTRGESVTKVEDVSISWEDCARIGERLNFGNLKRRSSIGDFEIKVHKS